MALTPDVAICLLSSHSDHRSQKRVLMLVCLVQIPVPLLPRREAMGRSLALFVPQFASLQNGDDNHNTCLTGLL